TKRRLTQPARLAILSSSASPQPAPPDTLQPAKKKSYAEAIELLKQSAQRDAVKWEPIVSRTAPEEVTRDKGEGFFTEGDNKTGEWKAQKGCFWTAEFWAAELWQLYSKTKEERFRRRAEAWNARFAVKEATENNDTRFIS